MGTVRDIKPVAILGTGPSGLLSAWACQLLGLPVAVFGEGKRSQLNGAQFLHAAIPELTNDEGFTITYRVEGTPDDYRRKVYGDDPNFQPDFVSAENVKDGDVQQGWSLPTIYDYLWSQFGAEANVQRVNSKWLEENMSQYRAVISSIPAPALCRSLPGMSAATHQFVTNDVKVSGTNIMSGLPRNTIMYSGIRDRSWFRCSHLQGGGGTEWPSTVNPPFNVTVVKKPIRTNCDCWAPPPEHEGPPIPPVIKVGRYGQWKKGVLVSDAFADAVRGLHAAGLTSL